MREKAAFITELSFSLQVRRNIHIEDRICIYEFFQIKDTLRAYQCGREHVLQSVSGKKAKIKLVAGLKHTLD